MRNVINRVRRMGLLFIVGMLVIIGVGVGIVYLQQGAKQEDLQGQIDQLSLNLLRPLPSIEKIEAEYDEVKSALSPIAVTEIFDIIIEIAEENGIDTAPDSGKFSISPIASGANKAGTVGSGSYMILSLLNIRVQGDCDAVVTFISELESGERLKTLVVKRVDIGRQSLEVEGGDDIKVESIASLDVDIYTKSGSEAS